MNVDYVNLAVEDKLSEAVATNAKKSRSAELRKALLPKKGGQTSKIGPGYNTRLGEFVRYHWDLNRAASVSPSLKRTVDRLQRTKIYP